MRQQSASSKPRAIFKSFPLSRVGPRLPNRSNLDDHIDRSEDMLGQGDESLEKCPCFGLWSWCHASDRTFAHQSSQGEGMYAKGEDPCLGSFVI